VLFRNGWIQWILFSSYVKIKSPLIIAKKSTRFYKMNKEFRIRNLWTIGPVYILNLVKRDFTSSAPRIFKFKRRFLDREYSCLCSISLNRYLYGSRIDTYVYLYGVFCSEIIRNNSEVIRRRRSVNFLDSYNATWTHQLIPKVNASSRCWLSHVAFCGNKWI